MRLIPFFLAFLLLASTLTPGLARSQDNELILRVAMQDDIKTLNPLVAGDVWTWNVLGYLYDSPIGKNPETDEIIPYIAVGSANLTGTATGWQDCDIGNFGYSPKTSWENQSLQEAIIFYDFENVVWHDGVQMDIRDIMFSMHMAAQVPEWSSSMDPLKADNFTSTGWLEVYKVWESPDKLQAALRFQVQAPYAEFFSKTLSILLLPEYIWAYKVSGQAVDGAKIWCDPGYDITAADSWQVSAALAYENNPPIGNGPFKFESWEKGQISKVYTFREHFFRNDYKYTDYVLDEYGHTLAVQPNIDGVTYKIFKTAEAAVLALKSDDIDYIAWSVPPTFVQELANEPGVALQQSPESGFFYLAYNMRKSSFGYNETGADVGKPLRQAIAHCIDKNRIVTRLLLNLGIAGTGPVSPLSKWYNESVPTYNFDPDEAKNILRNASYKLTDGSIDSEGLADISTARDGNWWLNPDGTPIGSEPDGLIKIYASEGSYTLQPPIMACNMIAQQLRDIGINAESVAMDFGSIVDRADNRDFDMYILGWRIGSDPTDFLHAFFHSGQIDNQNYPGYQNSSFDNLIDLARNTSDPAIKKKAILDAQAAICYDLPNDVLYFRTNIEAYRSDRFTGWVVGDTGSIYNWQSLKNLRAPSPYKVKAQFVSPPSAVASNSTQPITVYVKDQDGNPLSGAQVKLNASAGQLSQDTGITSSAGKLTVSFTAPFADPNNKDTVQNGTPVIISIESATYVSPEGTIYDPAPSRLTVIKVFPEAAKFLSVSMSVDPDVIDPDISQDGTLGFTYVEVIVTDQNRDPVAGASVALTVSPDVPAIEPLDQLTDANGKATFKITSTDLPYDDGSEIEYVLKVVAIHPTNTNIRGENMCQLVVKDTYWQPPEPPYRWDMVHYLLIGLFFTFGISLIILIFIMSILKVIHWRRMRK